MIWDLDDWVQEFLQSFAFQFLDDSLKDGAEIALGAVVHGCKSREKNFPICENPWNASAWRQVLEQAQSLNIPITVRRHIAHLTAEWAEWVADVKYPAAKEWLADLRSLESILSQRLREDGSLKGNTVVNKGDKVRPNDPCICGSGKKFKKCCGPRLLGTNS
jgi:hypothetical protein